MTEPDQSAVEALADLFLEAVAHGIGRGGGLIMRPAPRDEEYARQQAERWLTRDDASHDAQGSVAALREALLSLGWNENDGRCWCVTSPDDGPGKTKPHEERCLAIRKVLTDTASAAEAHDKAVAEAAVKPWRDVTRRLRGRLRGSTRHEAHCRETSLDETLGEGVCTCGLLTLLAEARALLDSDTSRNWVAELRRQQSALDEDE